MAKTSAIQKNLKRIKLVKKYAKKRAALKKIINNRKLELSERFEAQLKLNKLPKNSSKIRIRNIYYRESPTSSPNHKEETKRSNYKMS